ncbi:MAG TPA: response regulator transcription factor [Candidatus Scybalocola faecigallinarum]|uniref:Stage 0 sporulation protein A homolog n=1 Tax=Candidatus Scybalocola faecigallinarum TaxID=2840941 RepID=A0A9D1F6G4_9FIRM|nr:response regulator transcription factor [Candidatus Scybalocola faecigallinarum]
MKYNLLIVEDDADITELLTLYLDNGDFSIFTASNGEEAMELARENNISIALVDIMMPKMNGYEFIKNVRKNTSFPIIIISAKTMDVDEVLGLNIGADAYIKKPFNPLVVVAQVNAVLRRAYELAPTPQTQDPKTLVVGDLTFDTEKFLLSKQGKILPLTLTELKIMAMLMKSPQRVFTKAQLYECINGDYYENDDNTMMVHISNIRSKIEDNPETPQYIKTVRGLGYKIDYKET